MKIHLKRLIASLLIALSTTIFCEKISAEEINMEQVPIIGHENTKPLNEEDDDISLPFRNKNVVTKYESPKDLTLSTLKNVIREENVTIVGGDRSDPDKVKTAFRENAPRDRTVEAVPRFAIVGKDHLFYMGIGVSLRASAVFDFGDLMDSECNFAPIDFQPATPGNNSSLHFTAKTSSIYINIVAMPGNKNRIGLFFNGSFDAGDYKFDVGNIYARYRGLTVGYTDSPFIDGDAIPYTLDSQGPNGKQTTSTVVAYWSQNFGHGIMGSLGIDAPSFSYAKSEYTAKLSQCLPTIPLALKYAFKNASGHVRMAGLFRPLRYRDLVANCNKSLTGWGVQFSGSWTAPLQVTLYYDAVYGKGIGNYLQDSNDNELDATPSRLHNGQLDAGMAWGTVAGLKYQITKTLAANLLYSQMRFYPSKSAVTPECDYKYGQYVTANLIWRINRFAQLGLEYNYGRRRGFNDNSLHVNRLHLQWALAF